MSQFHARLQKGFTILELLVVITILAVLASAAFLTLEDNRDQQSYELTQERYENLKDAIIGRSTVRNGTIIDSGFVNDTGYLPGQLLGTGATLRNGALQELLVNPILNQNIADPSQNVLLYPNWERMGGSIEDSLASFGNGNGGRSDPNPNGGDDFGEFLRLQAKFEVFHGWRGPYLDQNFGQTDGSTNGLLVLQDLWGQGQPSPFIYFAPPLAGPNNKPLRDSVANPAGFPLFSLGKFGQFDETSLVPSGVTVPADEVEPTDQSDPRISPQLFHRDFPEAIDSKRVSATAFETDDLRLPAIRIRIPTEMLGGVSPSPPGAVTTVTYAAPPAAALQRTYVGAVYPGMALSGSLRILRNGANFIHPSLDMQPSDETGSALAYSPTRAVPGDPTTPFYAPFANRTTLSDLTRPNPSSETILDTSGTTPVQTTYELFNLQRQTAWNGTQTVDLYLNKPLARRYQLALFRSNPALPGANVRLASCLLGVHPQVFYLTPGTTGAAVITRGSTWTLD